MSEQNNIELIKRAYAAFKRRNLDGLLELFVDDFDFQHPMPEAIWPFADIRKGHKGFVEFIEGSSRVIEREHFEASQFIAQGEARIVTNGKSSPKSQVKTVGLLETSVRFQCPEKTKGFAFLNNSLFAA